FPEVLASDRPRRVRGGLQEFGLPYAADPAITRHLAAFVARHEIGAIDAVLFNGGAMTPQALRARVLEQIARWQPERGSPRELSIAAPELAVAEGAAVYGLVRRGQGVRIGGGTARSFYVGVGQVSGRDHAVCLAPKGIDEGNATTLPRDFRLVTNRPVSFKLYSSSTRTDAAGAVIPLAASGREGGATVTREGADNDAADLIELPPIVTVLRAPGRPALTVRLEVRVTELGALEIWCKEATPETGAAPLAFRLTFDMRGGGAVAAAPEEESPSSAAASGGAQAADPRTGEAKALLQTLFGGGADERLARAMKLLEETLEAPRDSWNTATTRALFDQLLENEEDRKRSAALEARWLHLAGFCLRPGTGAPLDEWRAKQMWRLFNEDLVHPRNEQCRQAWWITWRRISGGLSKGQQHQIYLRLAQLFLPGGRGQRKWDEVKPSAEEAAEMLRCLANLERISVEAKLPLGDELMRRLESRKVRDDGLTLWALSRIGARVPLYGPLNCVVPASKVSAWLRTLLAWDWPKPSKVAFSLSQLGRRTGDRARDIDDDARAELRAWLVAAGAERAAVLVENVVALEAREESIALGDTLPPGLHLVGDADLPPVAGSTALPLPIS
ncbi:MAG TPA: molecular chaperone DnaK, partial [Polyangia bacterium]